MSTTTVGMGTERAVRVLLWAAVAVEAVIGVWAQFFPVGFYEDFPLGWGWVQLLPPYNEHLVRDVGGLSLALVVVLAAAALRPDRWSARVAALAGAVFVVPHTIFHATHMAHFPAFDAVAQTVGNVGLCVLVAAIWVLAGRLPARTGGSGR
ncbi:hypothetical protein [Pseudonocardia humida]|uniref:Uncharacterized protein n=1 Tax=Pseudonocardia humida TaxID=2800819 RepID=A0ABT1A968_9PSEU|nr:hypothetical protein [Pseudonocardia humida]MCO1659516.1 hypothetical protein [Pseudonocardia humida]